MKIFTILFMMMIFLNPQASVYARYEYSMIRPVNFEDAKLLPIQENNSYFILSDFESSTVVSYELYSTEGKIIKKGKYETTKEKKELSLSGLSSAGYYIKFPAQT